MYPVAGTSETNLTTALFAFQFPDVDANPKVIVPAG
jgi:hypothetical protein